MEGSRFNCMPGGWGLASSGESKSHTTARTRDASICVPGSRQDYLFSMQQQECVSGVCDRLALRASSGSKDPARVVITN